MKGREELWRKKVKGREWREGKTEEGDKRKEGWRGGKEELDKKMGGDRSSKGGEREE